MGKKLFICFFDRDNALRVSIRNSSTFSTSIIVEKDWTVGIRYEDSDDLCSDCGGHIINDSQRASFCIDCQEFKVS